MITKLFLDHPRSVGETYGEHLRFALGFSGVLFAAGLAALAHAVIPCCFEKTASAAVARLHERTRSRGAPAARQAVR